MLAAARPAISRLRRFCLLSPMGLLLVSGCGSAPKSSVSPQSLHLQGHVHGGQQPVAHSTIQLYAAGGGGDGTASTPLLAGQVLTGPDGGFDITGDYTCPTPGTQVYLTASGGNPGLANGTNNAALQMLAALGACGQLSSASFVSINEVTTVASIIPLAPFMTAFDHIASGSGDSAALTAAFATISEIVDTSTGAAPGPVAPPAGFAVPIAEINSIANAIATCVNSDGSNAAGSACSMLFAATTPPSSTATPGDTAAALVNLGIYPTLNLSTIYNLPAPTAPFQPVLTAPPPDWNVAPDPMILLTTEPLGVGASATGTITLAQQVPNEVLMVHLVSQDPSRISISPDTVPMHPGDTTASFIVTSNSTAGTSILASANDYATGTLAITPTKFFLTLGSIPLLAPGQVFSLPIAAASPVASDTVVTLAVSNQNQGNNLTVSPSTVTIPAGATAPTVLPQITGGNPGTATLTATAPNYASVSSTVQVSVTPALATAFSLAVGATANLAYSISAPAPAGGLILNFRSSSTAVATVTTSLTIPAGATSINIPITGVASGQTTLTVTSPGVPNATSAVTVTGSINTADYTTGVHVYTAGYFSSATPLGQPATFTVSVANPAILTVSSDVTVKGTQSISYTVSNQQGNIFFALQGQAAGTTAVTISSPGFSSAVSNVTVDPSGFYIASGNLNTTTLSSGGLIQVSVNVLDPNSLAPIINAVLNPDLQPLAVTLTNSNNGAATLTTPNFTNQTYAYSTYTPVGSGTTTVAVVQPTGFTTPSTQQSINLAVTQPTVQCIPTATGPHVQTSSYLSLSVAATADVTVTVADPTIATVAPNATTTTGTQSMVLKGVFNSPTDQQDSGRTFWIQGQKAGTTNITFSAPGFAPLTTSFTLAPVTVYFDSGNVTVPAYGQTATGTLRAVTNMADGIGFYHNYVLFNPDLGPVNVTLNSSDPSIGTISSATFATGSGSAPFTFTSGNAGTTNLTVTQPAGFSTAMFQSSVTGTVTPGQIASGASYTTGVHLERMGAFQLQGLPPSGPVDVTVSSNSSSILIASDATTVGSPGLTFSSVGTAAKTFYIQGESTATDSPVQISISANGYGTTVIPVTVQNASFTICCSNTYQGGYPAGPSSVSLVTGFTTGNQINLDTNLGVNPDSAPLILQFTTSNSQYGTMAPVTFMAGQSAATGTFTPAQGLSQETDEVTIVPPAGFSKNGNQSVTYTFTYAGSPPAGTVQATPVPARSVPPGKLSPRPTLPGMVQQGLDGARIR